jgi:hypothetical protein
LGISLPNAPDRNFQVETLGVQNLLLVPVCQDVGKNGHDHHPRGINTSLICPLLSVLVSSIPRQQSIKLCKAFLAIAIPKFP